MPPLGLNLFIASFRFNRPVASLYRVVMPFAGILLFALILVSYIPWISDVAILGDIAALKAQAEKDGLPPRDAWMLECVQGDPNDPKPCSVADRQRWGEPAQVEPTKTASVAPSEDCNPDFGDCPPKGAAPGAPAEDCNPDFGACPPAGAPPAPAEDCNPDFGPCPTPGQKPAAAPAPTEDCNPDFGPCPRPDAGAAP